MLSAAAVANYGEGVAAIGANNTRDRQRRILLLDMPQGLSLEIDNAGIFIGIGQLQNESFAIPSSDAKVLIALALEWADVAG